VPDLSELTDAVRAFNTERDWHRFHDPKSLALALTGEVGELAELLQWVPASTVRTDVREGRLRERLGEELADILIYLIMLADEAGIDLATASAANLAAAARRFPPAEFAGRAPDKRRECG
jgi:NTP pyrophosphatase (non-canonical NTP hydrolase)